MREARVYAFTLHETISRSIGSEVTEMERPLGFVVVRVAPFVRTGAQDQCAWIDILVSLVAHEAPNGIAAKRCLERRIYGAAYGIDHLVLEPVIGTSRSVALRQQNSAIFQVANRIPVGPLDAVGLLDMEQPPARSAPKRLVRHVDERKRAIEFRYRWIKCKNPQRSIDRISRASLIRTHLYVTRQEGRHIESRVARVGAARGANLGCLRLPILRLRYPRGCIRSRRGRIAGVAHDFRTSAPSSLWCLQRAAAFAGTAVMADAF